MATEAEIIAMRENVIAPDSTLALLIDLRNMGGQVCNDAAGLIEFLIDQKATFLEALEVERQWGEREGQVVTRCADCKQDKSAREFSKRPNGMPVAYCKSCAAIRWRAYRRKRAKPYVPAHVPNPLNSLLRDMPGSRVSLLGIAGVRHG